MVQQHSIGLRIYFFRDAFTPPFAVLSESLPNAVREYKHAFTCKNVGNTANSIEGE